MKERERRSARRTCRRVTVRMEETPEARTVALKGAEEEAMVAAEVEPVLWREEESAVGAADSRTSGEGRSRCSRDGDVQSSFEML